MLREHVRVIGTGLRLFDLLVVAAAALAARRFEVALGGGAAQREWAGVASVLLFWVVASWTVSVYDAYRTRSLRTELARLLRATAAVTVAIAAEGFLTERPALARETLLPFFALSFTLLAANRAVLRHAARALRRRGYNARLFAVVGSGPSAASVVASLAEHPEWGYAFVGYIADDEPAPGAPVIGTLQDLGAILDATVLDEILFAVPREHLPRIDRAVQLCQEQGVEVKICLDLFPDANGRMSVSDLDGMPALAFSRGPAGEVALYAKRAFDVLASAVLLTLLAPVFLVAAIAIKLESPGPVFFRQRRVGLHGRRFTLLKFRSMCVNAEAELEALRALNEVSGPVFKIRRDPRVTRVGAFIRRTSIDELPQLWNVLHGEMSMVGPRPPLPSEVQQYKRWQRRRLSVKPGITCIWQVSGRNDVDFERWMQLDLEYIDHWSLWGDLRICLQTIPAVLTSKGAS